MPSEEAVQVFREAVQEYVKINNDLNKASKELRVVRQKKNELSDLILEFMRSNDYEVCSSGDAKLIKKESKRQSALKEEYILAAIREVFGADADASKVIESANAKREVVIKPTLSCKVSKK